MKQKPHFSHCSFGRRIGAAAAAVLFACALPPGGAVWAEEESDSNTFDDGTLTYTILNSTEVSVTSCSSSATHISIMPEIDGYDVVAIGEEAFANCSDLQALTIPASVTEIGTAAFYGCSSLTALKLPDAVTEIESGTFFGCTGLTELQLGSGVTSVGDMAFSYCEGLTELTLPDTLETIGDQVFYCCTSLESVAIPEKLTELGSYTFYGCLSLKTFEVPEQIENIGAMTFVGCPALTEFTVAEGNTAYSVKDGILYNAEQSILYAYPAGKTDTSFTVPEDVLVVYAGAFFAASNLTSVTLQEGLQYIGEMAFDFCTGLTALTIPESVATIGETAFSDCTGLTTLTFAGADREDGGEGEALEIGDYAFFCCENLKEVQLPKRVESIGDYAFGCTSPEGSGDGTSGEESDTSTDADAVVTVELDSGETLQVTAVEGFLLEGYTGAASDYVKDCELRLSFKSVNFNWSALVFWLVLAAAVLVIVILAIRIIRRNMMTAEEKTALRAAKEEQKVPLSQRENAAAEDGSDADPPEFDDGYRSIIADEEEAEAPAEKIAAYEETISHSRLHQIGHAPSESEPEEKTEQMD